MLWQECNLIDERLKFIAKLLDGSSSTYNSCGLEALTDRSRQGFESLCEVRVAAYGAKRSVTQTGRQDKQ
jgi:hypothetical protein